MTNGDKIQDALREHFPSREDCMRQWASEEDVDFMERVREVSERLLTKLEAKMDESLFGFPLIEALDEIEDFIVSEEGPE